MWLCDILVDLHLYRSLHSPEAEADIRAETRGKVSLESPSSSDINWSTEPQFVSRGSKFRGSEKQGMYYPRSENKGADQLRGDRAADLRLCFRAYKNILSHDMGHIYITSSISRGTALMFRKLVAAENQYQLLTFSYSSLK